jgi:hypothetical protein
MIPALAIALVFASSAFTNKKTTTAFYEYQSSLHTSAAIQNIANYVRTGSPCGASANVCGVTLTDEGANSHPDQTEFDNIKATLWGSQQAHESLDPSISMKN